MHKQQEAVAALGLCEARLWRSEAQTGLALYSFVCELP